MIGGLIDRLQMAGLQVHQLEADAPAPVFYSNAVYAVNSIRQEKATPAQWLAMLQKNGGIKAGEDKWLGLSDWLKESQAASLTKQEILDFLDENSIELCEEFFYEIEGTEEFKNLQQLADEHVRNGGDIDDFFKDMVDDWGDDFSWAFGYGDGSLYVKDSSIASDLLEINGINEQRAAYVTCRLDSYHEVALAVEGIESWEEEDYVHFGEVYDGRCIAWVRFGDKQMKRKPTVEELEQRKKKLPELSGWRKTQGRSEVYHTVYHSEDWGEGFDRAYIEVADKFCYLHNETMNRHSVHDTPEEAVQRYIEQQLEKPQVYKVLVLDEIQSNRHQEGRKYGYLSKEDRKKEDAAWEKCVKFVAKHPEIAIQITAPETVVAPEVLAEHRELEARHNKLVEDNYSKVFPAPFEKNWHELCMKRMLRYAAEKGYEKMVWTSGTQQNDRYQINEHIKEVKVHKPDAEGWRKCRITTDASVYWVKADKNGKLAAILSAGHMRGENLFAVLGKDLATKVLECEGAKTFKAEDNICLGGEGNKVFYDRMIPQFMNRYCKKWGVQVEEMQLPLLLVQDRQMPGVRITEEMRKSVMQGQPMFMKGKDGEVYGYTSGNRIWLYPKGCNPETLVHEYTHVWAAAMQHGNPEGWQSVKDLLRDTPVWNEVSLESHYQDIHLNEDSMASEVLARISGRQNAYRLTALAQRAPESMLQRMQEALKTFWSWVGKQLFDIDRFRSLDEVTDRILYDLLNSTELDKYLVSAEGHISNVNLYKGLHGNTYIRCKVDGVQQMGKPVKASDMPLIHDVGLWDGLAARYFADALQGEEKEYSLKR